ncbi:Carbonyl reductase 1 [Eumeta japonica]|uniref:Carbonyl reductase 1 n=1 Tax=Eumeta variegata TaxID=151549 RepID=A0A4C1XH35_EUMVA|nr:Carbonyl reductase 1 [Eumeta japonica]
MEMSREKVAVVTGANKGLGYEIVKALCRKTTASYLTARNEEKGRRRSRTARTRPQAEIPSAGHPPKVYQTDQTLIVNFFSLVDFCETISPLMRNGGCIVNVSSSSGHLSRIPSQRLRERLKDENLSLDELKVLMQGYLLAVKHSRDVEDGWGESPYVVSKVGVNAYTFILHRRLAPRDIRVNCVHPGYIRTDMTKGEGNVLPEQGADVVVQVALSDSRGQYVWHNGTPVPWCGDDPRIWIDGKV